jgi:hypothetical protein
MNQYVKDNPRRCMAVNLSPTGIYLNRLLEPEPPTRVLEPRVVGLEFELPGTSEVVWARGEVRFDQQDSYFHGTGVELTGIPKRHHRLIRDFVMEERARQLRKLLALIRRNRMH